MTDIFLTMKTEPNTWNLTEDEILGTAIALLRFPFPIVIEPLAMAFDSKADGEIVVMCKETKYFTSNHATENVRVILPSTCGHFGHSPEQAVVFSMS